MRYAGSAPTLACGVVQINMQVPANAAPGALALTPEVVFMQDGTTYFVDPSVGGSTIFIQ